MVQPLNLVGFPELNIVSITETDIELAVFCSNNTMTGHLYTIILSMDVPIGICFAANMRNIVLDILLYLWTMIMLRYFWTWVTTAALLNLRCRTLNV